MSIAARKPVLPALVVCCVLVGWFVWCAVPALAGTPEAPGPVVVGAPGAGKVMVSGVLSPHVEGQPGTYEFLYRASSTECEGGGHAPASPGLASGVEGEEVAQELTGLTPETEYTVCLSERSLNEAKGEETAGPAVKFKTVRILESPTVTAPPSEITDSSIKLQGVVNPGAPGGPGTYEFVYRRSASECQRENPETRQKETEFATPTGSALGGEKEAVPATAPVEVSGLEPNVAYTFCLLARNEAGETVVGAPVTFTTLSSKPSVSGESFSSVGSTGVTVSAQVDTGGLETTFVVQYGTTSAYGSETVSEKLSAGTSTVTTQLSGLEPDTEYHFRVIVTNADGSKTSVVDTVFNTLPARTGGLPDDRSYEMVTPVENGDSDVERPRTEAYQDYGQGVGIYSPFQVSPDGLAITYPVLAITGANGTGTDQYIAKRSSDGGWLQRSIQPSGYLSVEYQGFASDLSAGVLNAGTTGETSILPPLAPDAPGEGYKILYEHATSEAGYRALITNTVMLNRSPMDGPQMFGSDFVSSGVRLGNPVFAGGSADFKNLLFEANDALLAGGGLLETELEDDVKGEIAKGEDTNYLYEEVGDKLNLVDVSLNGRVVPNATFGAQYLVATGYRPDFGHVISADGRFVYWTDLTSGKVYVREDGSSTVQVSQGAARYWTASNDGRYAIYSEGEGMDSQLYRFDLEPETGHSQREVLTGAKAGVLGVLGASEDAATIYFVADGVLSGDNAEGIPPVEGQPNLYVVSQGESPVFIATLSETDGDEVPPFGSNNGGDHGGDWQPALGQRTARVTENGGSVVFMSNQSLSVAGYPHGYPSNGLDEVYVYEAGSDRLYCASCGSSGEGLPGGQGAAAYLPVHWEDTSLPQWISEDGNRVFFDTGQPLVAQDTNGVQDVYEWEPEGYDSCTHGDGSTGGCVFLLSGGTSEAASWFVGASANGNDVFMVTRAQLVPEDGNDAFDLYDAAVGGMKSVTLPLCTGSGCQGVPAPPPLFATPSSVTFNGVGNFSTPQKMVPRLKSRTLTRAQRLTNTLKACKRQVRPRKRVSCETSARRRYGTAEKRGGSLSATRRRKHV